MTQRDAESTHFHKSGYLEAKKGRKDTIKLLKHSFNAFSTLAVKKRGKLNGETGCLSVSLQSKTSHKAKTSAEE